MRAPHFAVLTLAAAARCARADTAETPVDVGDLSGSSEASGSPGAKCKQRCARATSDLMDGGTEPSATYSNMLWSWGQFLDHDLVATFSWGGSDEHHIEIPGSDGMQAHRAESGCNGKCREPQSVVTPQLDGGPIYSPLEHYTNHILRAPRSCKLRTSAGGLPPVTTHAVARNTEAGPVTKHLFLADDARVNEHAILTYMHTVWLREHNRVCDESAEGGAVTDPDEAFKALYLRGHSRQL